MARWSEKKAWEWYNSHRWIRGCNFIGSDCANRIDQWQSYGREERMIVADRELQLDLGGIEAESATVYYIAEHPATEITPVMARTGWAVGWKKETFWGKEALQTQREAKESRLTGGLVVTGRGIPRPGCTVLDADGAQIGEVTSGTFSPTLKQGIALALLDRGVEEGTAVVIDVRGRQVAAEVKKPPFVEGGAAG